MENWNKLYIAQIKLTKHYDGPGKMAYDLSWVAGDYARYHIWFDHNLVNHDDILHRNSVANRRTPGTEETEQQARDRGWFPHVALRLSAKVNTSMYGQVLLKCSLAHAKDIADAVWFAKADREAAEAKAGQFKAAKQRHAEEMYSLLATARSGNFDLEQALVLLSAIDNA